MIDVLLGYLSVIAPQKHDTVDLIFTKTSEDSLHW